MDTLTDLLCRVENRAVRAEIERRFAALEQERDAWRTRAEDARDAFEHVEAENAALREALEQRSEDILDEAEAPDGVG